MPHGIRSTKSKLIHQGALALVVIVGLAVLGAQALSPVTLENTPAVPDAISLLTDGNSTTPTDARPAALTPSGNDEAMVITLSADWQNTGTIVSSRSRP
jgi:hypothetical protein